jgi:hypothetical protein
MVGMTLQQRLDRDIDKSGGPNACWPWTRYRMPKGYGQFFWDGKIRLAHRYAYIAKRGPIPDHVLVRHKCDNPPCCNWRHLIKGDKSDNWRDAHERGFTRILRGEQSGQAKLTTRQVRQILKWKESHAKTAKRYGVGPTTIGSIRQRKYWKHV